MTAAAAITGTRNRQYSAHRYRRPLFQSSATSGQSNATGANTTNGLTVRANPTFPSNRKWRAWVKSQNGHGHPVSALRGQNTEVFVPTAYDRTTQAKPAAYTADTDR